MKKLLLLLLLPLGLFAHGPSSIMAPTVYDLTGAISEGQKVVSLITDQAEIAEYNLTPENNYLTINVGEKVQISISPSFEGKIKSPLCCGEDMSCAA